MAYITITMANSPRPGVWTLERSSDHGKTWQPWQHFAGNDAECQKYFNMHADEKIVADDQERQRFLLIQSDKAKTSIRMKLTIMM